MSRKPENDRKVQWQTQNDRWFGSVTFPNGKKVPVRIKGRENKDKAQKALDALFEQRENGELPTQKKAPKRYTIGELIDLWVEAGCPNGGLPSSNGRKIHATNKDENSTDQAEMLLRVHVKDEPFGKLYADLISRDTAEKHFVMVDTKRRLNARADTPYEDARLASSTVYRVWWHLANAVEWNRNHKRVARNAVLDDGFQLPPEREPKERRSFQREDLPVIYTHCMKDARAALWVTTLTTGMRPGEVIGLRWPMVSIDADDPEGNGIDVAEQAWFRKGKYKGQKKPKKGKPRSFQILPIVAELLRQHRDELVALGLYDPQGFVFPNRVGKAFSRNSLNKILRDMLSKLPDEYLQDWTMYELRHSFASLADDEVNDLQMIADLMGHDKIETTKGYRHTVRKRNPHGARIWQQILDGLGMELPKERSSNEESPENVVPIKRTRRSRVQWTLDEPSQEEIDAIPAGRKMKCKSNHWQIERNVYVVGTRRKCRICQAGWVKGSVASGE